MPSPQSRDTVSYTHLDVYKRQPFLLLTAALYFKGSPRLYNWLLNHRHFGPYIRNFRENKAIPLRAKIISLVLMWGTMLYCIFFLIPFIWVKILPVSYTHLVETLYLLY